MARFYALRYRRDVASLLEIRHDHIVYHLFRVPLQERYTEFEVPKRNGNGARLIRAPRGGLKLIQKKLARILTAVYEHQYGDRRPSVHGFRPGRSIVSNAQRHVRRNFVLRVDIRDFFPSITFPRVFGMFQNPPFSLGYEAVTTLAQICTFKGELPQGAPTSPAISNLLCARLDREMQKLARGLQGVHYTRYADDLIFSSWDPMPRKLMVSDASGAASAGSAIRDILRGNWFDINDPKTRYFGKRQCRRVTGLVVNNKVNVNRKFVRRVRSMLRLWKKHGLDGMQLHFETRHDGKHRSPARRPIDFPSMVRGRIEFVGQVRGKQDRIYLNLLWLYQLRMAKNPDDETLKYLTELVSTGFIDDGDRIQRCYLVRQSLQKHIGSEKKACAATGVSAAQWSRLGKLANNMPFRGTRHPENFAPEDLRAMTPAERDEIVSIADAIRTGYKQHLEASASLPESL